VTYHNKKGDNQLEASSLAIADLRRHCNINLVAALSRLLIEILFLQAMNAPRNQTDPCADVMEVAHVPGT
jgi:hypothetical protein